MLDCGDRRKEEMRRREREDEHDKQNELSLRVGRRSQPEYRHAHFYPISTPCEMLDERRDLSTFPTPGCGLHIFNGFSSVHR